MQSTDLTFPRPFRRSQQQQQHASHPSPITASGDAAVIATNSDAAVSKASCVRAGYYEDEFLRHFVVNGSFSSTSTSASLTFSSALPRRPPLINRGYFCRHAAVSGLVVAFLSRVANSSSSPDAPSPPRAQIVSLGAGSDTLFFRLHAAGQEPALFIELDLPEVVSKKVAVISSTPELAARVGLSPSGATKQRDRIVTKSYALLPCDLRALAPISTVIRKAQAEEEEAKSPSTPSSSSSGFSFDPSSPTLFISECVLVYLPPEAGNEVLRDALALLTNDDDGAEGAIIVYDPCRPDTAFGQQMATNLRARGCELLGIGAARDPRGAAERLQRAKWECCGGGEGSAADLRTVWERHLPATARARASQIEQLDELEEFNLIMEHYFLAVGVKKMRRKGGSGVLKGFGIASLAEETKVKL